MSVSARDLSAAHDSILALPDLRRLIVYERADCDTRSAEAARFRESLARERPEIRWVSATVEGICNGR